MTNDQVTAAIGAAAQIVCKSLEVYGPGIMGGAKGGAAAGAAVAEAFKAVYAEIQKSVEG